jgi:hypothetical protein
MRGSAHAHGPTNHPFAPFTTNVPNLDAMSPDDLMAFWLKHQQGRRSRELFPDGGPQTRTTTNALACYACNKATAMQCRTRGTIGAALLYERIADGIYDGLPAWAKW